MKNQHLALVVREERERQNLTQEHLAQLAELSPRTIRRLESDGAHSKETLMAVAEAFGIDGRELLRLAEERAVKNSEPHDGVEALCQQLQTKMDVAEDLRSIALEAVERLCAYWETYTPGWTVNENGKRRLLEWLRTYSLEELSYGMDVAATQYLRTNSEGRIIPELWEVAFWKIRGICRTERAAQSEPDLRDLYYIRGILRNKCAKCFDNAKTLDGLRIARRSGISIDHLKEVARRASHWDDFAQVVNEAIQARKCLNGGE
jgi:transcriptional regulator with XRE-family HTH domain